jgi:spermidine synthase
MLSRGPVFALFFVSGIAGLIYQVLWLRRLSLVFGVTVYAASTVLAAFMAGLAIGSAI